MVFASNDTEKVLLGNVSPGACMKSLKWLHFLSFSSLISTHKVAYFTGTKLKGPHYNCVRPRGKLTTGIFKCHIQKTFSQPEKTFGGTELEDGVK